MPKPIDYSDSKLSLGMRYDFYLKKRCTYCGAKEDLIEADVILDKANNYRTVKVLVCKSQCKNYPE